MASELVGPAPDCETNMSPYRFCAGAAAAGGGTDDDNDEEAGGNDTREEEEDDDECRGEREREREWRR